MCGYRRMGDVGQHLGHAMSRTSLHYHLIDLWRSPRGTVLRIEALALVAIALSFLLAAFGSCRRWSNSWMVQKGFLAAQVLSLSLGTYSIGLMQSSSVKSEMYPIWTVSLLTLFGCVDPVTSYNGLDYKGPLSKVIFQLCLYYGYVLLMSVSTISSLVGNLAIGVLATITFVKSFHRSMALILLSSTRDEFEEIDYVEPMCLASGSVWEAVSNHKTITDVFMGYSLHYMLRRRFLGLDSTREMVEKRRKLTSLKQGGHVINYKRALKAVEIELAFLYDVFFTSNEFIHYREAKTCSFWALASFIGICLVGVATAIPGIMDSRHRITSTGGSGAGTIVVATTTADLIVTLVILVSLALLQLLQLIQCWASNWARVAVANEYNRIETGSKIGSWLRLKAFIIARANWFDKHLWADKLEQYSLMDAADSGREDGSGGWRKCLGIGGTNHRHCLPYRICGRLMKMLGLQYIGYVLWELLVVSGSKGGAAVRLHDDVKTSVADFMDKMKSRRIGKEWSSLFADSGLDTSNLLPYSNAPFRDARNEVISDAFAFTYRVMVWHITTWYCELAEQETKEKQDALLNQQEKHKEEEALKAGGEEREKHRRVAMALSKFCAYMVVSAPELLPGPSKETKRALELVMKRTRRIDFWERGRPVTEIHLPEGYPTENIFYKAVTLGRQLLGSHDDPWKLLALLWVQTLLYAAPFGNMEAHRQHLSQGGQFITHVWAMLYHVGIDEWEWGEEQDTSGNGEKNKTPSS